MDAPHPPESPRGFALGKTFQNRSVSSPAPVTIVWRQRGRGEDEEGGTKERGRKGGWGAEETGEGGGVAWGF
jgi:hypothetical protein